MKNAKAIGMQKSIEAQNAETPRNPNTGGMKISGNQKNINTSGANEGGSLRKGVNTSGLNCDGYALGATRS